MLTVLVRQEGREGPMPRSRRLHSGRLAVRSSRKPNHMAAMVTTILSCVLLICFLIYDLVHIYTFFSDTNAAWSSNMSSEPETTTSEEQMMSADELLKRLETYSRQRALAATLVVLMILQLISGVGVYVGFEKKIRSLLLGYLVLTFPVMTFAMIYAIIFMVNEPSAILYVKIASVILVYTIQANVYRMVYRMHQWLKYQSRRSSRSSQGHSNEGYHGNRDLPPVHIQLKPPPYEKEPPPYELKPPAINPSTSGDINSPPSHSSHMTEASTSGDVHAAPSVIPSDLILSPTRQTAECSNTVQSDHVELSTQPLNRLGSGRSYDVPPSSTTSSVYNIEMTEEGLPPPYTEH